MVIKYLPCHNIKRKKKDKDKKILRAIALQITRMLSFLLFIVIVMVFTLSK